MSRGASRRRSACGWQAAVDSAPCHWSLSIPAWPLPATLGAGGMPRTFWVLLAFGGLVYEAEHRRPDLDALRLEADATGGALGGMETAERLIAHAEAVQL